MPHVFAMASILPTAVEPVNNPTQVEASQKMADSLHFGFNDCFLLLLSAAILHDHMPAVHGCLPYWNAHQNLAQSGHQDGHDQLDGNPPKPPDCGVAMFIGKPKVYQAQCPASFPPQDGQLISKILNPKHPSGWSVWHNTTPFPGDITHLLH